MLLCLHPPQPSPRLPGFLSWVAERPPQPGRLEQRSLFPLSSGGQKSETKVSAGLIPSEVCSRLSPSF